MTSKQNAHRIFTEQAEWCEKLGSPFTALLLLTLAQMLDRSTACGRIVFDWSGQPDAKADAVALRFAGALHGLVRAGRLPELAKLYPPHPLPLQKNLGDKLKQAIGEADDEICKWLTFAPQTNEVTRSALLYPGMGIIAKETGLSLSIYELGSSAGLNLMMDRFSYGLGENKLGLNGSDVQLSPLWNGPLPEDFNVHIIERQGCDLNPLDVDNAEHRGRLLAYIWPDQPERMMRTKAAIKIAQSAPPKIEKSDAADWVERTISSAKKSETVQVLFHSIAFQYFPEATKKRITSHMEMVGAAASPKAPLAWLAFEQVENLGPTLTLRLWRGAPKDGERRILARANNAHVHKVEWLN